MGTPGTRNAGRGLGPASGCGPALGAQTATLVRELWGKLVALRVDVIVTEGGTPAALAAKQATKTLPVVFPAAADPVTDGLVATLARPGGNVTGLSLLAPDLVGKRLEQFKQAVPGVSRVAVLWQTRWSRRTHRN